MKVWRLKYSELIRDRYLTRLDMNLAVVMSVLLFVVVKEEEKEGESECVYV